MNGRIFAAGAVIVIALGILFFALSSNPGTSGSVVSPMEAQTPVTSSPQTSEVTIKVTSSGFDQNNVSIKAGTKVTWINQSGQAISINSDPHPVHTNYPPLNLGRVDDGGSVSLVFDKPGTYGYHNHLNPDQKGTIAVE